MIGSDPVDSGVNQDGSTPGASSGVRDIPPVIHLTRLGLIMASAAALLVWLACHTDVLFADGLRYIGQAQALRRGDRGEGLNKAIDHPVYPLAIAAIHQTLGRNDSPESWQTAAQLASLLAGVFLVIPLYLVCLELFGDACTVPACVLFYSVPLTGHVFADALSESTFLLFWTWGLWTALRFLRTGAVGWVPAVVGFSALAYLSRPEGLLLPAALVLALAASPRWLLGGLGRRGLAALAVLIVGSSMLIGPYVALKGGLGTKPSIARLLGTAPKSAAHAVERQRPLEPGQSAWKTYVLAGRALLKAVSDALTWPLLPLAALGLIRIRPRGGEARQWRFLALIGAASVLALLRLHATGGYCSPRHAMVLMIVLVPAAGFGLERVLGRLGYGAEGRFPGRALARTAAVAGLLAAGAPEVVSPLNAGLDGYRQAGRWLAEHSAADSRVVDLTGWSQFYARREGYTFGNLVAAPADPSARWVVAREAHLKGPWDYCRRLRMLVDGLEPVEVFVGSARNRPTRVLVYDRQPILARPPGLEAGTVRR